MTAFRNYVTNGFLVHLIFVISEMADTCIFNELMLRPMSKLV